VTFSGTPFADTLADSNLISLNFRPQTGRRGPYDAAPDLSGAVDFAESAAGLLLGDREHLPHKAVFGKHL
jgi:hypothetical protein